MFETIIVPLDGSELAEAALAPALNLRGRLNAGLVLVRAVESEGQRLAQSAAMVDQPGAAAATVEMVQQMAEAERGEAAAYLEEVAARLKEHDAGREIREGAAAEAIIAAAEERNGPLIVMSSHGRGGLDRLVFGSVADAVLRESRVPLLLIRPLDESSTDQA